MNRIAITTLLSGALAVLLVACGDHSSGPVDTYDDVRAADEAAPPAPTSAQLILAALEAGQLGEAEAARLLVVSAFLPDDLPAAYRGAPPVGGRSPLEAALQWAFDHFAELSADDQAFFEPYLLEPDDPGSIFYSRPPDGKLLRENQFITFAPEEGSSVRVTIEYDTTNLPDGMDVDVKEAVLKSWQVFAGLFPTKPDANFTISLIDLPAGVGGYALWTHDRCRIDLATHIQMSPDYPAGPEPVLAHELFHCFQYSAMGRGLGILERAERAKRWLADATATLAEDLVYPKENSEQSRLDHFFLSLNGPQFEYNGVTEYASYMWFFFLRQRLDSAERVIELMLYGLLASDTFGSLAANTPDYTQAYRDFARANWNRDNFRYYQDEGGFPTTLPRGSSLTNVNIPEAPSTSFDFDLPPGGMEYHTYIIGPYNTDDIPAVLFQFGQPVSGPAQSRQALLQIDHAWTVEDWSDQSTVRLCRTDNGREVEFVVLILANADTSTLFAGQATVQVVGCDTPVGGFRTHIGCTGSASLLDASLVSTEELEPADEGWFRVRSQHTECQFTDIMYFNGEVAMETHCAGEWDNTYSSGAGPPRLLWPGGSGELHCTSEIEEDWVSCSNSQGESWLQNTCDAAEWPAVILEASDLKDGVLSGERDFTGYACGPNALHVEFRYELR